MRMTKEQQKAAIAVLLGAGIGGALALTLVLLLTKKKTVTLSSSSSSSTTVLPIILEIPKPDNTIACLILAPGQYGIMPDFAFVVGPEESTPWIIANSPSDSDIAIFKSAIFVDSRSSTTPSTTTTITITDDSDPDTFIITNTSPTLQPGGGLLFHNTGTSTLCLVLEYPVISDRRLKKDIELIPDKTLAGLPMYKYRYVWQQDNEEKVEGVMADELINAGLDKYVCRMPSGYLAVRYNSLISDTVN